MSPSTQWAIAHHLSFWRVMAAFDLKLLQAINDWQKRGAHAKASRGVKVKKLSVTLDARFRTIKLPCYRRIDLDEPNLQILGETLKLPETISAWTLSLEVAQGFYRGVPPKGTKTGIIVRLEPADASSVVANLDALFGDAEFRAAQAEYRDLIKQYERGMGRYDNEQREVVIECEEVRLDLVLAFGGHSSSRDDLLARMQAGEYGAANATPAAIEAVRRGLDANPARLGPQWLQGPEAVQRTRDKLENHAKARAARRSSGK